MSKCYRFSVDKWSCCPVGASENRAILRDWCIENDYEKVPLYITDDVYVWARDKSELHMVITSSDWNDLPSVLENRGEDIFAYLIDRIASRHDDDYDPEEAFYDYLVNN